LPQQAEKRRQVAQRAEAFAQALLRRRLAASLPARIRPRAPTHRVLFRHRHAPRFAPSLAHSATAASMPPGPIVPPGYARHEEPCMSITRLGQLLARIATTAACAGLAAACVAATPASVPEFTGIAHWINSPPLTMQGLRGKVVL